MTTLQDAIEAKIAQHVARFVDLVRNGRSYSDAWVIVTRNSTFGPASTHRDSSAVRRGGQPKTQRGDDLTYGFEPPDPHEIEGEFASCGRCHHLVPNDEQHLHDGIGRWVGFYLCTDCLDEVCIEIQAAAAQHIASVVARLADKYRDELHRADAIFAQRHSAERYAKARRLMGIDDTVN